MTKDMAEVVVDTRECIYYSLYWMSVLVLYPSNTTTITYGMKTTDLR